MVDVVLMHSLRAKLAMRRWRGEGHSASSAFLIGSHGGALNLHAVTATKY